jgi:membrane fusion protein, multidrug efflux system
MSLTDYKFPVTTLPWLLLAILFIGCGTAEKNEPPPIPVVVSPAEAYQGNGEVRYSANIQPYSRVDLAFKSGGYLTNILQVKGVDGRMRDVHEGDYVKRGEVLAQVRQSDYEAKLAQAGGQAAAAQSVLEHASLDLKRARNLYAANSLTKSDYDKAVARYGEALGAVASTGGQVKEARIALQDTRLKAPTAALVLKRKIEVGDLVNAGTVGFTVANTEEVKVVFGISDLMLKHVKLGDQLAVTTEALRDRKFPGLITAISPSADPKSRVFDVEITIPNPDQNLKVGMIAAVAVAKGQTPTAVTVVPLTAVVGPRPIPRATPSLWWRVRKATGSLACGTTSNWVRFTATKSPLPKGSKSANRSSSPAPLWWPMGSG